MQSTESKRPDIMWGNVAFLFITPILAVIGLIWWFTSVEFYWAPIIAYVALHFATGLGITAGYHRLFSHRSYKANNVVKVVRCPGRRDLREQCCRVVLRSPSASPPGRHRRRSLTTRTGDSSTRTFSGSVSAESSMGT